MQPQANDRSALLLLLAAARLLLTLEETGARRLLVETFSPDEMRLFAAEVLRVLK